MACKYCKAMPFETTYHHKGQPARYRTQSPTPHHAFLRSLDDHAYSGRYDLTVNWPFGPYMEITVSSRAERVRMSKRARAALSKVVPHD